jgi:hypothetical protein
MTDDLVDLDEHRDRAAQNATKIRRQRFREFQADQAALLVLAAPAETWPEAAAKARYLIKAFAATPEAQDPCHKDLIAHALDDLARLCDDAMEHS